MQLTTVTKIILFTFYKKKDVDFPLAGQKVDMCGRNHLQTKNYLFDQKSTSVCP
jgi:hypothetical protein